MDNIQYGYYFHHADFPDPHTSDRVEIFLGPENVPWLFPTKQLNIWTIEAGRAHHSRFIFNSHIDGPLKTGPGNFELISWRGDTIEGFCFGGNMTITKYDDFTAAHISSPAPIFRLDDPHDNIYAQFGAELGTLFAKASATLKITEYELTEHLAKIPPLQVMAFLVYQLQEQFHRMPVNIQHADRGEHLNQILHRSINYLEAHESWPPQDDSWQKLLVISK